MNPVLEMKNISKSFPGVKALSNVNLAIYPGEVHALLGENGAGKSTLIKILAGIYQADQGEILLDGKPAKLDSVEKSMKAGISVIHQELCLAENMSVAQNIFMGRERTNGPLKTLDKKGMERKAQAILDENGLSIYADALVGSLTVAQQQMVEIAKALSQDARIIVMDEPTASLSDKEVISLFETIKSLKKKGVAIIYISHRLDELYQICQRVSVLRDGEYIGTGELNSLDRMQLIKMMVGRELNELFVKPITKVGKPLLEVRNISSGMLVKDVSFTLYQGEILGFYGLVGAGRTELMRVIFGVDRPQRGEIWLDGKKISIKNTLDAIRHGIALVPESRKQQGAVMIKDVEYNLVLSILDQVYLGILENKKKRKKIVDEYISRLRIKVSSPAQLMRNLSGGNQQKVIIAKWLATTPKILILDEPTRGIDVGAKKEIYQIMSDLAKQGVSIIMVSSDMPEIINMSTRIITMQNGRITSEMDNKDITQEELIIKATGGMDHAI